MARPLEVYRCPCGKIFGTRPYGCPSCGGTDVGPAEIPGEGSLYAFTTIRVPPPALAAEAPYHLALVEFPGGLRVVGRLEAASVDNLTIGTPMEVTRIESRGPVFRPQA